MRQLEQPEMRHLIPAELQDKSYELFGNLEEIYTFHGDIFLQDLENCISTTELVALCFTHRVSTFYYNRFMCIPVEIRYRRNN